MKKLCFLNLIVLIISNIYLNAQCDKISVEDAYIKINKGFKDDYSLDLSSTKVTAQNITFFPCSNSNYDCFNAFQFCLVNYTDLHIKSIKYRLTIKSPDNKTLLNQVYTENISLKPEGVIPIKQFLKKNIKTRWSFYQHSFPINFEIINLGIDIDQTTKLMFNSIKEMGNSSINEGVKKGIIERYEYIKKIDPSAEDNEAKIIYLLYK